MRILVAGGSGFIGRELIPLLHKSKDTIFVYTHQKNVVNNLGFQKEITVLTADDEFPEVDVIVNLSGESIAEKRLSKSRLEEIQNSRIETIELLSEKYANNFPSHFIQASATGIYKDNCQQDETGELSDTVYASICKTIEYKAKELQDKHKTNISICRIGVVIGDGGGLVNNLKYLPRLYIIGGDNYIPYLSVTDCALAIRRIITNKLYGVFNLCSDHFMTANQILKLASSSKFLTIPIPKLVLKFDKRGDLLLTNQRIIPKALKENGFVFDRF